MLLPFARKECRTWNLFNIIVHINVYCKWTNNRPIIVLNGIDDDDDDCCCCCCLDDGDDEEVAAATHFCFQIAFNVYYYRILHRHHWPKVDLITPFHHTHRPITSQHVTVSHFENAFYPHQQIWMKWERDTIYTKKLLLWCCTVLTSIVSKSVCVCVFRMANVLSFTRKISKLRAQHTHRTVE